jgi:hypothetical protein
MGNRVQRNSIFSNGGLGIDLGGDGVTPNDELDADESPNRLQNFPAISGIDVDGQVTGTLHSTPDSTLTIDVYLSPEPDPSGNGEGKTWIQEIEVETDDEGDATFEFDLDLEMVAQLQTITVTATDATGEHVRVLWAVTVSRFASRTRRVIDRSDRATWGSVYLAVSSDGHEYWHGLRRRRPRTLYGQWAASRGTDHHAQRLHDANLPHGRIVR